MSRSSFVSFGDHFVYILGVESLFIWLDRLLFLSVTVLFIFLELNRFSFVSNLFCYFRLSYCLYSWSRIAFYLSRFSFVSFFDYIIYICGIESLFIMSRSSFVSFVRRKTIEKIKAKWMVNRQWKVESRRLKYERIRHKMENFAIWYFKTFISIISMQRLLFYSSYTKERWVSAA